MGIRTREVDSVNILDIDGRIDINSSDIIENVGWLTSSGKVNIVLNLENVDLVDYSGLSILAISYKNAVNHKGRLKFLNVPLPVMELFKVAKLESVFEVYSDEESAINSFRAEGPILAHLRRRFKRLDMHLIVKYMMAPGHKKPTVFEGNVLNISAAGIYIYSRHTFPVNTMLNVKLMLPGTPEALEMTGRVIWLPDREIQEHSYPGMGVSFIHLTPEKEKMVIDFIDKNLTYRA